MARTVFMFSGQGSQYYQMGKELFDGNRVFRDWMLKLDARVRELSGYRVLASIYSGEKSKPFDNTAITHPAIFMVEYSLAQCLISEGIKPDCTLGASLGSFAAAAIAGHVTAEDALAAVIAQAAAFEASCEPGTMVAVLASPSLYENDTLRNHSAIAAVNLDNHFSIAVRHEDLHQVEDYLRNMGVTHQRLPVRFAYHSKWIDQAHLPFVEFMQSIRTVHGELPLVCCEQARTVFTLPVDFFWKVVREPIRFKHTIAFLEQSGPYRYIDVGPSGTLSTFVTYAVSKTSRSTTHAIITPFGREQHKLEALRQLDSVH